MATAPRRRPSPAPARLPRSAGVLLHVTSLPSKFGLGDLGPAAYRWVDELQRAKQTWWQVLPLTPVGEGNSPYSSRSAFAGNPMLVSPELLVRDGLLKKADLPADDFPAGRAAFGRAFAARAKLLGVAFDRFRGGAGGSGLRTAFDRFRAAEADWLDDFALFSAIKDEGGKGACWVDWPRPLAKRVPAALAEARRELAGAVERLSFEQFLFRRQLDALRAHAKAHGVRLFGDVPIYVSHDSADVWANRHLFQLDAAGRPTRVAGVPPDLFSATGQRWGNPLYEWEAHAADGFAWWGRRFRSALRQADLVRLDHFRGLAGYWSIRASDPTAEKGKWVPAPGVAMLTALRKHLGGLPLVAEDLGVITPDVEALRDDFALPGMRILQFAFGDDDNASMPHRHVPNAIAYSGTHDNDTTIGWHRSLDAASKRRLHAYAPEAAKDPAWALLRLTWMSVADVAVAPMQDVLSLGTAARMNMPGRGEGNWGWRMTEAMPTRDALARLADLTHSYGREPASARTTGL
ncbi:MAG TPA: 4-alpha-glucanotransferase [Humisphaera sp.]